MNPYESPQTDEPIIRAELVPEKPKSNLRFWIILGIFLYLLAGLFGFAVSATGRW